MQAEQDTMSRHNPVAKAIAYMFKKDRWEAFTRFLDDGRICLTNNAAERALRGIDLGRIMALRRLRARRRPCRPHVFPDPHREDERHRPASVAG